MCTSRSLTKSFVSIKGIYYQARVLGVDITWLVPHAFPQSLPEEVDFRVMNTFVEVSSASADQAQRQEIADAQ